MKILLMASLFALSSFAFGDGYVGPMHTPEDVIQTILRNENLDRKDVKVILLQYDYLKKEWHVELAPTRKTCIDCYPSYFLENAEPLKVKKLLHG